MVRPRAATPTGSGPHSVLGLEGRPLATRQPQGLVIAHVPFTAGTRFARKVANIAAVVAASGDRRGPNSACHWRRWLEVVAREGSIAGEVARNIIGAAELVELPRAGVVKSVAELLAGRRP